MNRSRTIVAKISGDRCPERGCVVLDQPQHISKTWGFRIFHALRLVCEKAALLSATLTTTSLLLLCPASARAQGGVPLWTNLYPIPYSGGRNGISAVDSNGNVFVTGYAQFEIGNNYYDGGLTIKYSNSGTLLWTNRYLCSPSAIAVDSAGSVFVTGVASSGPGTYGDYATIKFSNAGVPLWTNHYDGPANLVDVATAIAIDSSDNVIVAGYSANSFPNGGCCFGDWGYATVAYSNSGVPLWTNRYEGGDTYPDAPAIAVDRNGNVFVLAQSGTAAAANYTTVAYSRSGDLLWINDYDGPGNAADYPSAIAVGTNGNVVATGGSVGPTSSQDYATIAYSNDGVPLWTNRYNGPANRPDDARAIAVDGDCNVFVTGASQNSTYTPDFATVKYSPAGVPLWTRRYNGPANYFDVSLAIAVDSSGNVFVAGYSENPNNVGQTIATVAYSNSGMPLWTNRFDARTNNYLQGIAVDRSGNVFVSGYSEDPGVSSDLVVIKYSSSVPPPRLDFQKLNNQLVLSWANAGFNLQSAPYVGGTFTNIPSATSPYTNSFAGPQQFFRLISN